MATITTVKAKKKMLLARAGEAELQPITQMVFGSGGVDESGNVIEPTTDQTELNNEIYRKDISSHEVISDTQVQYVCELTEEELNGKEISELALADANGDLMTINTFKAKTKDSGFIFKFKINDTM